MAVLPLASQFPHPHLFTLRKVSVDGSIGKDSYQTFAETKWPGRLLILCFQVLVWVQQKQLLPSLPVVTDMHQQIGNPSPPEQAGGQVGVLSCP